MLVQRRFIKPGKDQDILCHQINNEMFGWESYRKDARLYNDFLTKYLNIMENYSLDLKFPHIMKKQL